MEKKDAAPTNGSNQGNSQLIKGMLSLENKNVIQDLQSKRYKWEDLEVPEKLIDNLKDLSYNKPSIIQAVSIPNVFKNQNTNYLFQALNGSGKTGAFAIPALMRVDPTIDAIQVLILANTRELIRQIQQVMQVLAKGTGVSIVLGEKDATSTKGHIYVTTPNYVKSKIEGRAKLDLSHLKMVVYDEADELYLQHSNLPSFVALKNLLTSKGVNPQHLLFSATFTEEVQENIKKFINEYQAFPLKVEALKLKGVKQYKISIKGGKKFKFIQDLYEDLPLTQTMIFVNKKDTAEKLLSFLTEKGIKTKMLIGGMDLPERDRIIDEYRQLDFTSLISTNVLARGIDVPEVDLVVNYDVPFISQFGYKNPDYANYIHRVGRTGRFGTDGLALTITSDDTENDIMEQIAKYYSIEIQEITQQDDFFKMVKELRRTQEESKENL